MSTLQTQQPGRPLSSKHAACQHAGARGALVLAQHGPHGINSTNWCRGVTFAWQALSLTSLGGLAFGSKG